MTLSVSDFAEFYAACHPRRDEAGVVAGPRPFPWQQRLLERVVDDGWPDLLDLPTGSGKTSALDVALFALALDAARPPPERVAPRRVVLVVDRRVVVSQATSHARAIQEALSAPPAGTVAAEVATRLRSLAPLAPGGIRHPVVHVAELRGGIRRDDVWAHRPDVPVLAASTVDQIGSRLLFRGYGVGRLSSSIHAGLLGNDVLLLLDEVHLSEPFRQTIAAVKRWYRHAAPAAAGLPDRWRIVEMSATPSHTGGSPPFGLEESDRADKVLKARLASSKPATLRLVAVRGDEEAAQSAFARALAEQAADQIAAGRRRVCVVVNRVNCARTVAKLLAGRPEADVDLVTGRMRPWDRDEWLKETGPLLSHQRASHGRPRIVVATQCIEAGADFDFDGLVTECASLDALRQRFGRLDRQGRYSGVTAVIAMRSDRVQADDDPVYGAAMKNTWAWLTSLVPCDFGIDAMSGAVARLTQVERARVLAPRPDAPVLLPAHLDLWAQTSQVPFPEPDLGAFLHGPQGGEPEVELIWRADLLDDASGELDAEAIAPSLQAVPPAGLEALSLPLRAVKAWLVGRSADFSDVEAARPSDDEDAGPPAATSRRLFRWSPDGTGDWVSADAIEAHDLLLVPASHGGLWRGNWDPTSGGGPAVRDVGDEVQLSLRGWRVRRLHPAVIGRPAPQPPAEGEEAETVAAWLTGQSDLDPLLGWFASHPAGTRIIDTGHHLVLRARRRLVARPSDVSTADGDDASFIGAQVTLDRHLADVGRWARELSANLGFAPPLVDDVALAGHLHDLGKADPRFQLLLAGGSQVRAAGGVLLAKSAMDPADQRAAWRARERSGYPRGCRHELLSLALIESADALISKAHDRDLVLHLVASHHGWCRPFAPAIVDEAPREVSVETAGVRARAATDHALAALDSGVSDRFWALQRRYGWWGLAWLEATLRLADHRASQEEEITPDMLEAP